MEQPNQIYHRNVQQTSSLLIQHLIQLSCSTSYSNIGVNQPKRVQQSSSMESFGINTNYDRKLIKRQVPQNEQLLQIYCSEIMTICDTSNVRDVICVHAQIEGIGPFPKTAKDKCPIYLWKLILPKYICQKYISNTLCIHNNISCIYIFTYINCHNISGVIL